MALGHGANIVRDGLVLHLDAANPKSYPGTGTVWTDLSGNGNSGTLVNSVEYSEDNKGSMVFDGVNDYVDCIANVDSLTSITFDCWAKISSTPTLFSQFLGFISSSGAIYVAPNSTNIFGQLSINGVGNVGTGGVNISIDEWTNSCVTWESGSTIKIYINGLYIRQSSVVTGSISSTGGGFRLARYSSGGYINSRIGNSKIYNRALTPAEIKQNFEALRGRYEI
jgi:hypothetical protein